MAGAMGPGRVFGTAPGRRVEARREIRLLALRLRVYNARPEGRGAEGVGMQTGRAIPRPLQAAR